jgi:hypothetical protein
MLPKERIRALFGHSPTDKVPVGHIGFSSEAASRILGREAYVGGGIQQWREACALWQGQDAHAEFIKRSHQDAFDLGMALGEDLIRMEYWRMRTMPARRVNEHTFLYGDPDGQWQLYRFDPATELYQVVDQHPKAPARMSMRWLEDRVAESERELEQFAPTVETLRWMEDLLRAYGQEHALRLAGGALHIPYDPPIWLEATALRPDLVERHLDVQLERQLRSIEPLAAAGVEFIFGGGDLASNEGPFYSPLVFHQMLMPRLRTICDACHRRGIRYLFGSDGNLWPVADDLFDNARVDGYYEVDRRAGMDLARLRERYPGPVLMGNMSSATLHTGTRQEVIAETRSCLEVARRMGGVIVGVSNYVMPGTPSANLEALIETLERER